MNPTLLTPGLDLLAVGRHHGRRRQESLRQSERSAGRGRGRLLVRTSESEYEKRIKFTKDDVYMNGQKIYR